MEDLAGLLPLLVLGVLAYFLFIRPARNRAKDVQKLQNALSAGDEVMLTSGIFATVEAILDERIQVSIAPGVSVEVHRGAIGKIIRDVPAEADPYEPAEDEAATDTFEEPVSEPGPDENSNERGAN